MRSNDMTNTALFERNQIAKNIGLELFQSKYTSDVIFSAIKDARDDLISEKPIRKTEALLEICGFLDKDPEPWLTQSTRNLFNYHDTCKAWYTMREIFTDSKARDEAPTEQYSKVMTYDVCTLICYAYYRYNQLNLQFPIFEDMIRESPPPDFTRPHGWAKEQYYSIGEVIAAIADRNDYSVNILQGFQKQFWNAQVLEDLKIPYDRYSAAWEEAHSPALIKPWSIEHCVYYVMQNDLPIRYIFEEKAPREKSRFDLAPSPLFYLCPSFKYFDVFALMRFLSLWDLWEKLFNSVDFTNKWQPIQFIEHCREKFIFTQAKRVPGSKIPVGTFYWLGIEPKDDGSSFHDLFEHWISFFGDLFSKFSFSVLLQCQISIFYPYLKEKKLKTTALEKVFKMLFEKQINVNEWIQQEGEAERKKMELIPQNIPRWMQQKGEDEKKKMELKPKNIPKWDFFPDRLMAITQLLPITESYASMNKEFKIHKEVHPSFKLIYGSTLENYMKSLEFSDLVCILTKRNVKTESKAPKWKLSDREICALNGMALIYPENHPKIYQASPLKSPPKNLELKSEDSTNPPTYLDRDFLVNALSKQDVSLKEKFT